jgi:hypothetical protein
VPFLAIFWHFAKIKNVPQKLMGKERATDNKEDARTVNFFLDTLQTKVHQYINDLMNHGKPITSQKLMDYVLRKTAERHGL